MSATELSADTYMYCCSPARVRSSGTFNKRILYWANLIADEEITRYTIYVGVTS